MSPIQNCRWLKDTHNSNYNYYNRAIHIFGEYQAPLYELWKVDESLELTDEYPLVMPDAPNDTDYSQRIQFKLKNIDTSSHSYSLSIVAARYIGDSLITNYYKLSTDGGATKLTTVTITDLAAGAFSGAIDIWGNVIKANNPADGLHYFGIEVTQTV